MNMNEWNKVASEYLVPMGKQGVFLTTADGDRVNTMTMSWSSAGIYWQKPVLTLPVRFTRYTREFIEKTGFLTVSVPKEGSLSMELALCGTKSGRDIDKIAQCGFTMQPGRTVPVPVIAEAKLHFECRVLYKTDMSPLNMDPEINKLNYAQLNYHTLYFAEVLDFYEA